MVTLFRSLRIGLMAWTMALLPSAHAHASEPLTLAVHPVLPADLTRTNYQPLASYLSSAIGQPITLVTHRNFLTHWQMLKRGSYDLVIEGPHFIDYRIHKLGWSVLAKFPGKVSYTLVCSNDNLILDPAELIGKTIATTPSPAIGALALSQIYPNTVRQPYIVEAEDADSAANKLLAKQAAGAMIPTPLLGRYPDLVPVFTTEQVTAPGIVAAPSLPEETRAAVRKALLEAGTSEAGRQALAALSIEGFESASADDYQGLAPMLKELWDY